MALERGLEGRDQLLKLVKRHAREIQELYRAGLQRGEPYTSHGSCLLSLYCDVRGASYHKESGINSTVPDVPSVVVTDVARTEEGATQAGLEALHGGLVKRHSGPAGGRDVELCHGFPPLQCVVRLL